MEPTTEQVIDLGDRRAMSAVTIPLNSRKHPGLVALIDEEDYDLVSRYYWHPNRREKAAIAARPPVTYAQTSITENGRRRTVSLHRFVLGEPVGLMIDHVNFDGLDCRKANLRLVTQRENTMHARARRTNPTRFKGIIIRPNGRWQAGIWGSDRKTTLGTFDTAEEAAMAYDEAAIRLFGEFAATNFPSERKCA